MMGASLKLRILLAILLVLNVALHTEGHALFVPASVPLHWTSNSRPTSDPQFSRTPAECLLCRTAAGLVAPAVALGVQPPVAAPQALSPPRSFPYQQVSINSLPSRAPPAL